MKQTVELEAEDWKQVLGIISNAPWNVANPLLMKIGAQLQAQEQKINSGAQRQGDTERAN